MYQDIIKVPYLTVPSMQRYYGPLYNSKPDILIINEKKEELEKYNTNLFGSLPGYDSIVNKVSALLCKTETNNIVDLALNFEEDIAILKDGKLISICFCFPSSWIPAQRLGLSLAEIHTPVADNEKLVAISSKIASTISSSGPYRRYVWTITNNPKLSNYPSNQEHKSTAIDNLYFRYEIQTTLPIIDENACVFFVKVSVVPLNEIWVNKTYRELIVQSINSMSDNILQYKKLTYIKELLNKNV